jgi:hypothetical protein
MCGGCLQMRNALDLNIRAKWQLLDRHTSPGLHQQLSVVLRVGSWQKLRLTGNGFSNIWLYPSFIAPKSFIVVMKTLTLTTFFRLDPPASRTLEMFFNAWI